MLDKTYSHIMTWTRQLFPFLMMTTKHPHWFVLLAPTGMGRWKSVQRSNNKMTVHPLPCNNYFTANPGPLCSLVIVNKQKDDV